MRIQSVKAGRWVVGLWLLAAGCGGGGSEPSTTRSDVGSAGGEPTAARSAARFDREPSLSREEIARETPAGPMPETAVVAQLGGEAAPLETTTCPADLEGLQVRVAPVPDGAALVLRAANGDDERLRARMRLFAKVHEVHQRDRPGPQRFADPDASIHQASDVRIIDTPEGVRLEVRDPSRTAAVREELREDAEQLRAGNCPLSLSIES